MATVTVNLSQSVLDTILATRAKEGPDTMHEGVDVFFQAAAAFSQSHPTFTSAGITGSVGQMNFSDGAYERYTGIVDLTPNATNGKATATGIEEFVPNAYRLTLGGKLTFDYTNTASSLNIEGTGGVIADASVQQLIPATSPQYSAQYGNLGASLHGNLTADVNGSFSGTVTSFEQHADRFFSTAQVTGNFAVSGNSLAIGLGGATSTVSGTLTGYSTNYRDGSAIAVSGAAVAVSTNTQLDEHLFADAANFGGNDTISVTLPAVVADRWVIAAGAGQDSVTLRGGGGALWTDAGSGNDAITLLDHGHTVDGGDGADTVNVAGARTAFSITKVGSAYVLKSGSDPADVLRHVETLSFSGSTLDVSYEDAVQSLYVAYFGRAADTGGMANFQRDLALMNAPHDLAGLTGAYSSNAAIRNLIDAFGTSDESKALYSGDTTAFVTAIYQNVFSRTPDKEGLDYWVDSIDHKGLTKANASLSIMAGALSNTTAQGQADAQLVLNRTAIASDFTFAIDTPLEVSAYSGDAAAASVRALLATVDGATNLDAFQASVQSTLQNLVIKVGVSDPPPHTTLTVFGG